MDILPFEEINLLLDHTQRLGDLWNFQIVVSASVIGLLMTDIAFKSQKRMALKLSVLTILFFAFAIYNGDAIKRSEQRRHLMWTVVRMQSSESLGAPNRCPLESRSKGDENELATLVRNKWRYICELGPDPVWVTVVALLVFDVIIVVSIWIIPWARGVLGARAS